MSEDKEKKKKDVFVDTGINDYVQHEKENREKDETAINLGLNTEIKKKRAKA